MDDAARPAANAPALGAEASQVVDEATMRALNSMDCSLHLMDERMKQSIESARGASQMLKRRAALEEEYAQSLK
ncbi:hypothetical protein OLN68_26635, partial [Citrobacter freundii]|nr:hypothetical protein [Citrobacter freundii]